MSKKNRNRNRNYQGSTSVNTSVTKDFDTVEYRMIEIGKLNIDHMYQRNLVMPWAQWIADHFDPNLVETLQVSYRDGRYWVFDGQHTLTALNIKFKDKNYKVMCKVYRGLTATEEAKLFYEFNTCKRKMSAASMFKARAAYGDEEIADFLKHTLDAGFIITPGKNCNFQYGIQAVATALKSYTTLGPDGYDRVLHLLHDTWDGEQWSVSANMLNAVTLLVKTYGKKLDDKKFISKLREVTRGQLSRTMKEYDNHGASVAYAMAMLQYYNYKIVRKNRLDRVDLLDV